MVALVTIGCITIAVVGVYVGKWLKRIGESDKARYIERLKKLETVDKNLKAYVKGRKNQSGNGD